MKRLSLALAYSFLALAFSWTCVSAAKETDPCKTKNYKLLSNPDRAAAFITADQSHSDKDDFKESEAWYRFTGNAGDRMAKQCVAEKRCGADVGGWLNGALPSKDEGIVNRTVCFHYGDDCCLWRSRVKVRNCSGFYLYYLKRDVRGVYKKYRYCGNGKGPDPCDKGFYNVLDSADRAEEFITDSDLKCDRKLRYSIYHRWNRFNGSAGVAMSTKCVDTMRCGAEAPGWLQGKHPRVSEGVVTRTVCYHWQNNCCYFKNKIQVKNCQGYYVYKLEKPPAYNLRYCGNGTGLAPHGSCKHKDSKREGNPCITGQYLELSQPDRAVGYSKKCRPKCDQDELSEEYAWYRFTGKAGTSMATRCVPMNHCATDAPGWLNGSLPKDKNAGEVSRTVCFRWKSDCCRWKTQIKVRNCGKFYLFYLNRKNPLEGKYKYRYCGNGGGGKPPRPKPTNVPTSLGPTETQETTPTAVTPAGPEVTTGPGIPTEPEVFSTTSRPPENPEVNLTCGQNEMWISIPKRLLPSLDREHLRLFDVNCGANETQTNFILHTKLTECHTVSKHTNNFVIYMNKVLEIPLAENQIITRVREVEIPFTCYYSNMGVVSAVGIKVESKQVIFSSRGLGRFVLEMKIFPDNSFVEHYKDFPIYVPLRELLYVEVSVDTDDTRLQILAENCFATPDPDPNKPGLKYEFIRDGCIVDETVTAIPTIDKTKERFSIEAFTFIGDYQFVYMHCQVRICNATDPSSRCAQGCLHDRRRKRSLDTKDFRDEQYSLAQGPIMGKEEKKLKNVAEDPIDGLRSVDIGADKRNDPFVIVSAVAAAVCIMGVSYMVWSNMKPYGYHAIKQE